MIYPCYVVAAIGCVFGVCGFMISLINLPRSKDQELKGVWTKAYQSSKLLDQAADADAAVDAYRAKFRMK